MTYQISLKEERVKPHQITTLHLICALTYICAGAIIAIYNYTIPLWGGALLICGIALTATTMLRNTWLLQSKINLIFRVAELALSAWVSLYSYLQAWKFPAGIFGVLAAAILFSILWEKQAGGQLVVEIDDEGVRLPVISRTRFLKWVELETVVLRHGTLSLDCEDGRLFQWTMGTTNATPDEIEKFCAQMVEQNRGKREEDW